MMNPTSNDNLQDVRSRSFLFSADLFNQFSAYSNPAARFKYKTYSECERGSWDFTFIYQNLYLYQCEEWCSGIRPKLLRSPKISTNPLLRPFSPTTPFFAFAICFDFLFGISIFPVDVFSSYCPAGFGAFERRDGYEQTPTASHSISQHLTTSTTFIWTTNIWWSSVFCQ